MAGFEILAVLGLLGLLALSSMACLPRSDDDLLLVDNSARLDALMAIGIASLEQMQRIEDDTWQGASTDSDDEIDDSVLANLQLPTSTDSTLGGVDPPEDFPSPGAMWGLIASRALLRNFLSCLRAGRPAVHLRILRLRRTGDFVFLFGQQCRPSRAHNVCSRLHTQ